MAGEPLWLQDQIDAAIRERDLMLAASQHWSSGTLDPVVIDRISEAATEALGAWSGEMCSHLKWGPRPSFLYLSDPSTMLCGTCAAEAVESLDTGESYCDICQRQTEFPWPVLAAIGPVTIMGSACPQCRGQN